MPFVVILGAGDLGGALACTLASRMRFDEVRLIDPAGTVAAGKALDVRQSGPSGGSGARVSGHADIVASAGAWVIVMADPVSDDPAGDSTVNLLRQATRLSPGAILVCAAAGHAALLTRLVGEAICPPDLVVGSAPTAAASAVRALLSAACGTSASDISAGIDCAESPAGLDIAWSRTAVRGRAAEHCLTREQRDGVSRRLALGWPPGPLTLASAAARCAEAAWFGSRRAMPLWTVNRSLNGAPDTRARVVDLLFEPAGRMRPADGSR